MFQCVCPLLSSLALDELHVVTINMCCIFDFLALTYQERHDAKTVSQLKQFVQKLPHMQQAKISLSKRKTALVYTSKCLSCFVCVCVCMFKVCFSGGC